VIATTHNHSDVVATASGLCYPPARLTLGFARAGWLAFLAEAAPGVRSGTRIVASATAARLWPRRRVPALGLPWHRPLGVGTATLAVAPSGSGPGTALLTVGSADRVILDARWAGGSAWGPFGWDGPPSADVVIVDSRRFAQPGCAWGEVVAAVRAWARGGRVAVADPVVGAVLALDLAAAGIVASVRGACRRALRQWVAQRLVPRVRAADLLAGATGNRPLVIGDGTTASVGDLWIGDPAMAPPRDVLALAFSRFGAPAALADLIRDSGARTVLDAGRHPAALAEAVAAQQVEVTQLRAAQLVLPETA